MLYIFLGLGRSGLCAAEYVHQRGYEVGVWDDAESQRHLAISRGLPLRTLEELQQIIQEAPAVTLIISPGIGTHILKERCVDKGHRVICDIQLFFDFFPHIQAIGVTGSNGKSTTCALIHHALLAQGKKSILAGNIGIPIFSTVSNSGSGPEEGLYVLELSSYQLELCDQLSLKVGVLLNVVPHHLDRHGSLENYQKIKEKIFSFSRISIGAPEFRKSCPTLVDYTSVSVDSQEVPLGFHQMPGIFNVQAAYTVLTTLGFWQEKTIKDFRSLPHRQELVGCFQGIYYWNDSKATTPHAAAFGIQSLSGDLLYWIGGGVLQEDSLEPFILVASVISAAFLIGQAADRYQKFLSSLGVRCYKVEGLNEAIHQATQMALSEKALGSKSSILLSPGCASFDQFRDFEDRGNQFKTMVQSLEDQCYVA